MVALLVSPLWTTGAVCFSNANWLCAKALLWVVGAFAQVPGGHVYVELPRAAGAPVCEFTAFDLHGGGATHLRAGWRDWLLDCGHASRYPRTILHYLRSRGVNRLDGLLLSHGDADHIGSAIEVLNDFSPRLIVDSPLKDRSGTRRALFSEMQARQLGKRIARRGDAVSIAQLATLVGTTLGSPHPVQIAEPAVLGQAPSRYVPEVQRAAAELGLRQTVPLAEAIRRTANWWRAATPTTLI